MHGITTYYQIKRCSTTHWFVEFFPNSNGLVVRARHYEIGMVANSQRPNLVVVTIKFLNILELREFCE